MSEDSMHEDIEGDSPSEMPRNIGTGVALGRNGRVLISPEQPLPDFDSPNAQAYAATLRSDPSRPVMAMICNPNLPPRFDMMSQLRGFHLSGLLKVADWGMIHWGPDKQRVFTVVLDRPGGRRVFPDLNAVQPPLHEDQVVSGFMQPILAVLKELHQRNVTHRGIRPNNIFYNDSSAKSMVLGDGVTSPPAYDQPALFEPIESAMAIPVARGSGIIECDLYSLGVTALFLLLGRNPVADKSAKEIIMKKLDSGSYSTLVGMSRLPLGMMEALRGLLSDDPKERWTTNDLEMWLSGRRLSPKQPKMPSRSSRPFHFQSNDYFTAKSLACAFAEHYEAAASVVRTKALDAWIRRGLADEKCANALQTAVTVNAMVISGRNGDDRIVARACIALDPDSPIRYRGVGLAVSGLGSALSANMNNDDMRQLIGEVVHARLPSYWVGVQEKASLVDLQTIQSLEKIPTQSESGQVNSGIERMLYELNSTEYCRSSLLIGNFVTEIGGLIPALDGIAQRVNRPELVLDRHLIAFLAARLRRTNEEMIRAVSSTDLQARALAILRLFSGVQEQTVSSPAPHLAQWLLSMLLTVAESLHHHKNREKMLAKLKQAAQSGRLLDLVRVIDDPQTRAGDIREFQAAVREYRQLEFDGMDFDNFMLIRNDDARVLGEQIAAAIGGVAVSICMAVMLLVWFS